MGCQRCRWPEGKDSDCGAGLQAAAMYVIYASVGLALERCVSSCSSCSPSKTHSEHALAEDLPEWKLRGGSNRPPSSQ